MRNLHSIILLSAMMCLFSCKKEAEPVTTPWGTILDTDSMVISDHFSLSDIQINGELIMLTLTGPESYYDYHGRGMGWQYLLCEKFANQIGVRLRVDVCKDTAEMVTRLQNGEADLIAFMLPDTIPGLRFCGEEAIDSASAGKKNLAWAVMEENVELADTLNAWFSPTLIKESKNEATFALSTRSITRKVYSPMLDKGKGVISRYDAYFKQYAPVARWDWRLLAAQCYQESTFDPQAKSWAGACGLMQIMPSTASHLGLSHSEIFNPEKNIAAAVRYIKELESHFSDVGNANERRSFVLASYNGGYFHIRDAMALAKKDGKNSHSWRDVSGYVLKLSDPKYYNDPVVKYGYMRGSETHDYVERILSRWSQYRGMAGGGSTLSPGTQTPQRAKRQNRFTI